MTTIRVAACQIDPAIGEVDDNLELISRFLTDAQRGGAALAIVPEASVTGYGFSSLDEALPVARRAGAVAADRLADLSASLGIAVVCGTLEAEGDEIYNVALISAPDGRRFRYRKMHLPFLGVDRFVTPGPDAPAVVELAGIRVGVIICYDLRFPEAARVCALEGADLIALPTNWPVGVDFHPDLFAPARAAENHCYLLAADRVGTEGGTTFMGRSVFVDPDGRRLGVATDTEQEILFGEVDVEAARATHVRRRPGEHEWDTIADRRPGLYDRLLQPGVNRQHPASDALYSGDVE
ncbi:MAG TPA: carbon-nitrogen hydrolase family protein [Candidatus Limnocylindria bacterium]|nr:carbon-nitrogen hydrolase family protein [Candidatus Limnocylindria bacterium]